MSGAAAMEVDLLALHRPALLSRALRLTGNGADAEDLVQETLIRAHRGLSGLADHQAALGWMFRILERVNIDRVRKHDPLKGLDIQEFEPVDPRPSSFTVLADEEMNDCAQKYLERLAPDQRQILQLHDVDEHTVPEIASILGISVGAAKIRLHRARAKVRAMLDAACTFSRDDRGNFVCEPRTGAPN